MAAEAKWTVMVYMVADSDDGFYQDALDDIQEMEKGLSAMQGPGEPVRIVVQVDAPKPGVPQLCEVRKRGPNGESRIEHLQCPPEILAFDGKCLLDFVRFCINRAPANNYLLVLWGHSDGIDWKRRAFASREVMKGFGGGPGGEMVLVDIAKVMEALKGILGNKQLVVGFDSCLMGMAEVYYQIRSNVSWVVAAADELPRTGWPYDPIFQELASKPTIGPRAVAELIAEESVEFYAQRATDCTVCFSGSQLSETNTKALIKAVAGLVVELKGNLKSAAVLRAIKSARRKAQDFQEKAYVDLFGFCVALAEEQAVPPGLLNAAAELKKVLKAFVPIFKHSPYYPEIYLKYARAVNVCFPEPETIAWKPKVGGGFEPDLQAFRGNQLLRVDWEAYEKLSFNQAGNGGTGWVDFLIAFWNAVGPPESIQ